MKELMKCEIHNLEYEANIYPQIGIITKCPECLKEMREKKAQEQKGDISHLKKQVRIKLGKSKECKVYYIADFVFYDNIDKIWVVADSKGVATDTFKVKLKWLLDTYSNFRFDLVYNNKLESFYPYDEKNPELIKKNEKN